MFDLNDMNDGFGHDDFEPHHDDFEHHHDDGHDDNGHHDNGFGHDPHADTAFGTSPMMRRASPEYTSDGMGGVIVTDIIGGQHHYSSMAEAQAMSDVFSGFPVHISGPSASPTPGDDPAGPQANGNPYPSMDEQRLQKDHEYTGLRDEAVQKYHDALDRGDNDAAAHWHDVAFDMQRSIDTLWHDIGKYGLETYVPGIGSE